jgi:nitrite reductase/ring-hydroxylating ferredoxin subunit
MDTSTSEFVRAGSLEELKAKGRLVVHGRHRPILLVHEDGHVFALDNRCPHMGFPLDRGSIEDGILTCHWHHARFELASGCTFDLWADDVPTCPVEIRAGGEIWVRPVFGYVDAVEHWRQRLEDGLGNTLSLVIAKAVHGQLAADQSPSDVVRQAALFGTRNRDGWDTGLTILTALGRLLPFLSEEETHLALFHGVRRVAADCDGAAPSRERAPLASRPDLATLKRWLRRWVAVRHRDAAERTVLTAIAGGASPAALADLLFAAETTAPTPMADTRSISSTRPSSVLTSSAGSARPMCCRAWSARWRQLGVLRKGPLGANPSISSLCASGPAWSCPTSSRPATTPAVGRIT